MSTPLVSIVTVTLNCAEDAVRTARSVLAQTHSDYEYVIKDGGSTDGTADRLRALGLAVTVAPDRGIYDAMNQALRQCRGEYVYFLNAGDTFVAPDVLAQVAERLDRHTAIAYGELVLHPMQRVTRQPARLTRYYLFRKNLNHQAFLARRDVYQRLGGFNLAYHYSADQEFVWRVVLQQRLPVQHLGVTLANFVYGGASTRRAAAARVTRERWRLLVAFYRPWEITLYGITSLYFLNPLKRQIWYRLHRLA